MGGALCPWEDQVRWTDYGSMGGVLCPREDQVRWNGYLSMGNSSPGVTSGRRKQAGALLAEQYAMNRGLLCACARQRVVCPLPHTRHTRRMWNQLWQLLGCCPVCGEMLATNMRLTGLLTKSASGRSYKTQLVLDFANLLSKFAQQICCLLNKIC